MNESTIQRQIRLALCEAGCVNFRNNVGVADYVDRTGTRRKVTYGLCPGSSDLIGWTTINGYAVFVAVEVKRPGQNMTDKQMKFINAVNSAGGIAFVATSPTHAVAMFKYWAAKAPGQK